MTRQLWSSNAPLSLFHTVWSSPSHFVCILFLKLHIGCADRINLWYMDRVDYPHNYPPHNHNCGLPLPTKEWDCCRPYWDSVCRYSTTILNAWCTRRVWYVVSLPSQGINSNYGASRVYPRYVLPHINHHQLIFLLSIQIFLGCYHASSFYRFPCVHPITLILILAQGVQIIVHRDDWHIHIRWPW